jgi:uncharacterized protein YcaQ
VTFENIRALAVSHTLFPETTLARAVARLGFVQADPIKAPATAQLVLRHRVRDYAAGDLERHYARLAIEEDYLYAYGFLARATSLALHPRPKKPMTAVEKRVLAIVRERGGTIHPTDIADGKRVTNAWGGQSRATTWALERLHRRGLLRVARRERGIRVYAPAPERDPIAPNTRLRTLVLAVANVLSPILERTLRANVARFRHLGDPRKAIAALIKDGELTKIDDYLATTLQKQIELDDDVRLLAPFDPIVWDRRRFEHLFGWAYRFEAYTPIAKRIRGYYALPILFRDRIVGWANVTSDDVTTGFIRRPRESAFERGLEEEIDRIRTFADVKTSKPPRRSRLQTSTRT